MTVTRKALLGAAAAAIALGVAGAGSASAFSWGAPSGPDRSVTVPGSDVSLNFTRQVMQDFH